MLSHRECSSKNAEQGSMVLNADARGSTLDTRRLSQYRLFTSIAHGTRTYLRVTSGLRSTQRCRLCLVISSDAIRRPLVVVLLTRSGSWRWSLRKRISSSTEGCTGKERIQVTRRMRSQYNSRDRTTYLGLLRLSVTKSAVCSDPHDVGRYVLWHRTTWVIRGNRYRPLT